MTLHDPQAHQTIVFSPSNWEVVAFDSITKAETAYEVVLFQQGDALELRFVPAPFAPGAFAVVSFQPDAAALVGFGRGPLARIDAVPTRWVATPVLAVPALTVATGTAGRN